MYRHLFRLDSLINDDSPGLVGPAIGKNLTGRIIRTKGLTLGTLLFDGFHEIQAKNTSVANKTEKVTGSVS